ncbi:hypothetical protein SELMODRAFT_403771 [Selaginella moellendorffii]|uniref:Chalcone synthase n=1 Tax=Selaginella moellendorffii TaxID=88036 RepID=D8QSH3_SELML|nr:chalcone synthase [Selaginella moellendorffii]EFJ37435.1 hypothetical protein SELMODRAFT_403771 [Selaginella moellendorffii]|eukprot:XP_002962175.1 chalcone synthase [Selaginella moellendorffii]
MARKPNGVANVLAIGTAVPPTSFPQSSYPEYFFRATKSTDKPEMMQKFQRICDRSGIKKRHFYLTSEILEKNPEICSYMGASLDARQEIGVREVPMLAKEAASAAIAEWGQPKSAITHLVLGTTSSIDMPGADFQLLKLLGLRPSVKRVMIYQQGCFAGGTVLRIAKDLAENNENARVLVACSEITAVTFRAPSDKHLDGLVGSALFGDGAAALIVGADPRPGIEKPLFEIHSAIQTVLPESDGAILGHLRECGLVFHLLKDVPGIIAKNLGKVLGGMLDRAGVASYNDLFWVVHPGGPAILDQMVARLQLDEEKMRATRQVLADFGNMSSSSVLFVLEEMRKGSTRAGMRSTGEGCDWGIMLCFGPGLTVEALLLKSTAV